MKTLAVTLGTGAVATVFWTAVAALTGIPDYWFGWGNGVIVGATLCYTAMRR